MELTHDLVTRLAYALGIGVLIGLERSLKRVERSRAGPAVEIPPEERDPGHEDTEAQLLGVRTYTVLSLTGFAAALLADRFPIAGGATVAGLLALILVLYARGSPKDLGITTEAAAIASVCLGALCFHHYRAAGVVAILITILLAMKRFTAVAITRLSRVELTDTLKFLLIIFLLLPLLPNRALDPFGAFNPYKVTLLVILISGISFVGYFLTKFLGARRGLGLTGLLGGLTSSTAVTAAMATRAKEQRTLAGPCTLATVIANATMFARVLVVVGLLDRDLVLRLAASIGTMLAVALAICAYLWIRSSRESLRHADAKGEVKLSNPFSLGPALKFAVFFVVILVVAKVAKTYLGDQGLYLASLLSGLADVDAITLSVTEQTSQGSLLRSVGAIAITIAVISNSVVKSGIAVYSGGWKYGRLVGVILLAATGAGLVVLLVF
jgi:uncharacterized membrane protein (DUF4010 family)